MTEPHAPLSDEDLSAALDGMAGPDVAARLQADPSARERLDALRAASQAIGQAPAVPDPGTFDALIARAIQVGTETTDSTGSSPIAATSPDGVVTPLAPRRRTSAGGQRWLVAAVVVALVAIGLGLVYAGTHDETTQNTALGGQVDTNSASGADDSTKSTTDSAETSGESSEATPNEAPAHGGATPSADSAKDLDPTAQQPADLDQLGSFVDVKSLRNVLRSGFPQDASPVVGDRPTNVAVDRCNTFIQTVLGDLSLVPDPDAVGYATVDGNQYLVYEYSVTNPSNAESKLITAAEPQSCDLLFTFVR